VDKLNYITSKAIDVGGLLAQSHHPKAGAIVLFSGEVRDHNAGRMFHGLNMKHRYPLHRE
jgi:molybdopterin synthase catalytic subunit